MQDKGCVKLLLDTNVLIWWMEDNPRLGSKARNLLANPSNLLVVSVVSIWEITMKWRIGKHSDAGAAYASFASEEGVTLISVTPDHVAAVETLAMHHRDPFDHMIIAQARVEGARIITSDAEMARYGVPCFPAG